MPSSLGSTRTTPASSDLKHRHGRSLSQTVFADRVAKLQSHHEKFREKRKKIQERRLEQTKQRLEALEAKEQGEQIQVHNHRLNMLSTNNQRIESNVEKMENNHQRRNLMYYEGMSWVQSTEHAPHKPTIDRVVYGCSEHILVPQEQRKGKGELGEIVSARTTKREKACHQAMQHLKQKTQELSHQRHLHESMVVDRLRQSQEDADLRRRQLQDEWRRRDFAMQDLIIEQKNPIHMKAVREVRKKFGLHLPYIASLRSSEDLFTMDTSPRQPWVDGTPPERVLASPKKRVAPPPSGRAHTHNRGRKGYQAAASAEAMGAPDP